MILISMCISVNIDDQVHTVPDELHDAWAGLDHQCAVQHPDMFAPLAVDHSVSLNECTFPASSLYGFTYYPGIFLDSYVYDSFTTTNVSNCATQCKQDLDCNSFIFKFVSLSSAPFVLT